MPPSPPTPPAADVPAPGDLATDPAATDALDLGPTTLRVTPLGGCGEFGLNTTLYEVGAERIVVDCGIMFPDDRMLGIDRVLPDLRALAPPAPPPRAYLLTHGHEDHLGALPYALRIAPAPVYGTELTLSVARRRLAEVKGVPRVELRPLVPGHEIALGPAFRVEPVRVAHSIPEAVALAIRTPAGLVLHTGDYKLEGPGLPALGTDLARLEALGTDGEGVRVLVGDSTGALEPGTSVAESLVREALAPVFAATPGRVVVALFSSHVERIATVAELALAAGRRFAWEGRRLRESAETALRLGHLRWPPGVVLPLDRLAELPPRQVALAITGTQGEPGSVLQQLALGEHPRLVLGPGDTVVISARILPGAGLRVARLMDRLCEQGVTVVDGASHPGVHASGHGRREDLLRMLELTRPRALLPVHGRPRMLAAHAALGRALGVPEIEIPRNGTVFAVDDRGLRRAGRQPYGRILVDGKGVGDVEEPVLRERRALGETGTVVAIIPLDPDTGELVRAPTLSAVGLRSPEAQEVLLAQAGASLALALGALAPSTRRDPEAVAEHARRELRRFFRRALDRRPVVLPLVIAP